MPQKPLQIHKIDILKGESMRFLRVAEVAELLSVRKETVYQWINRREIAAIHLGRDIRIDEADLRVFLENRKTKRRTK